MPDLSRRRSRGFTLIELMVTVTLLAILMALAMPSFRTWVRNSKIRAVGDSLQSGLRLAQSEALRRNRQVVFALTNDAATATDFTASSNGTNWALSTVKAFTDDVAEFIQAGVLSDVASGVTITGPAAICFNAIGRVVSNPAPGITGANCGLPTGTPALQTYNISFADAVAGEDRPLNVTVALGGQLRMCDPAKTLNASHPDGCP